MKSKLLLQLKNNLVIDIESIIYIKSDGHYLEFITDENSKKIIARNSLKNIYLKLPTKNFLRVHRSFVININYIQKFDSQKATMKNGEIIPLSRTNKLREYIRKL